MNGLKFLVLLLIVTGTAHAERRSAGFFFGWGVFVQDRPKSCFAITRPLAVRGASGANASASISFAPGRPGEVHVRLRTLAAPGTTVLLKVGARSFPMAARGQDAWLADARADQVVIALARTADRLTVDSRSATGARIRDSYALKGAASAIDAAAVACART